MSFNRLLVADSQQQTAASSSMLVSPVTFTFELSKCTPLR